MSQNNLMFVVTTTAKEYSDYQKKQAKKHLIRELWAILIGIIGLGYLFHLLYQAVHP